MSEAPGWLTVKKRGRDDAQIERDRKIALQRRKQHRTSSTAKANKASTQKSPKQRFGVNKKKHTSLDTLDSVDDFIVEDDDEEEEIDDSFIDDSDDDDDEGEASFVDEDDSVEDDDEEDDDDGDEKVASKKRPVVKPKKHAGGRSMLELHDDDNSSIDSFKESKVSSFFPNTGKKLTSKAIPLPSQRGITKAGATMKNKSSKRSLTSATVNPLAKFAYKENRITTQPNHMKTNSTTHSKPSFNQNVVSLESSDSDSDVGSKPISRVGTKLKAGPKKIRDDVIDDDSSGGKSPHPSEQYFATTLRELEDTPTLPQAIRKNKLKRYQAPVDKPALKQQPRNTEKKKLSYETSTIDNNDFCSDDDEAIAIACAIAESTKSVKSMDQPPKWDQKKKTANNTIYLPDPSDDDDEEDDGKENARNEEMVADYVNIDDDDEENDEDALAAKSILETAKELSRRILRTMAGWTHTAMDGIIVDGALALSTIANTNTTTGNSDNDGVGRDDVADRNIPSTGSGGGDTSNHEWISNDTMVQILPNVTLSEYQLIGVNWIALLHGMKCEVEGTKKYTNVNGILADGTI